MVIVHNFNAFPPRWQSQSGERGVSCHAKTVLEFLSYRGTDPEVVFLVNCNPRLTLELGAARAARLTRTPLVIADLVMRVPATLTERAVLAVKKNLFRQADLFIHYFRDWQRYSEAFGIPIDRHAFVPFKVNLAPGRSHSVQNSDGDYVLCFGRSLRDFDTFFDAMERVGVPGAIARTDPAELRTHHARFTRTIAGLPANLRILDDDGSEEAQFRILSGARIVVLPILKSSVVASGISTCLNAMSLGKCVIGSEGPGMSDIFDREIIAVPPEDPSALAAAIRRAWHDPELRAATSRAGLIYAAKAGGEKDLYQRIIDTIVLWYRRKRTASERR